MRRGQGGAFQWVRVLPGDRSSRSSYGGDEIAEAFGMRVTTWRQRGCAGRHTTERRASLEKDDVQARDAGPADAGAAAQLRRARFRHSGAAQRDDAEPLSISAAFKFFSQFQLFGHTAAFACPNHRLDAATKRHHSTDLSGARVADIEAEPRLVLDRKGDGTVAGIRTCAGCFTGYVWP